MARILVANAGIADRQHIVDLLSRHHTLRFATSRDETIDVLEQRDIDVVLVALSAALPDAWELLRWVGNYASEAPCIAMCETRAYAEVKRALDLGACQYFANDWHDDEAVQVLARVVERAAAQSAWRRQADAEKARFARRARSRSPLLGEAPSMVELRRIIRRFQHARLSVLIEGPTGAGKEIVALTVHNESVYGDGPFCALNMARLQPDLMASELFGHRRGAFTGAVDKRLGAFQLANGGTLFLDEVGDLPLPLQGQLLRVLETREVRPVGSDCALPVDVRIVAATHRDLQTMAAEGAFRLDLLQRLAGLRLRVPPLHERLEDVPLLAQHFLSQLDPPGDCAVLPTWCGDALAALQGYHWPGNVRELRSVVERLLYLCDGHGITRADVLTALGLGVAPGDPMASEISLRTRLRRFEASCVREALRLAGGNLRRAAQLCRDPPSTFFRRVQRCDGK